MRIGLVLPALPAYSETFFRNKILGLQKAGMEVILFINGDENLTSDMTCEVYHAPKLHGNIFLVFFHSVLALLKAVFFNPRKSLDLFFLNRNDKISFKKNLKLILSNQFLLNHRLDWLHFGFGTMVLGRENVAKTIEAKMAVSFRGFDYYFYPLKNKNCYSLLFKKEVSYHVLSLAMKKGLEMQGVSAHKISVIPPAIDTQFFDGQKINIETNTIQITTISRLHSVKGLDYLLQAMDYLKEFGVAYHLSIIGDGEELSDLISLVKSLELESYVTFTGKLTPAEVKTHLKQTEVYVQYSIEEGFCNAVLEAQAMGLLCIVSDAEGLTENVIHGQTGWVVPKRAPIYLANKIKEVISLTPKEKAKIQEQARLRVRNEFNLKRQQQKFLEFYEIGD